MVTEEPPLMVTSECKVELTAITSSEVSCLILENWAIVSWSRSDMSISSVTSLLLIPGDTLSIVNKYHCSVSRCPSTYGVPWRQMKTVWATPETNSAPCFKSNCKFFKVLFVRTKTTILPIFPKFQLLAWLTVFKFYLVLENNKSSTRRCLV